MCPFWCDLSLAALDVTQESVLLFPQKLQFRQEQIESISTVVEKISEFKGSMGSSLYDMKSQVDSCEKIVIRLV